MTTKRVLLIAVSVLFLFSSMLQSARPSSRRYLSDAIVVAKPYTNIFFARSFESQIVQTIPGVLALRVTRTLSAAPRLGVPVLTNGVGIRIMAVGSTPEEAQRAANEAAIQICQIALTNYGVRGQFVDRANSARKYSYFHDTFQPAIGRLFRD